MPCVQAQRSTLLQHLGRHSWSNCSSGYVRHASLRERIAHGRPTCDCQPSHVAYAHTHHTLCDAYGLPLKIASSHSPRSHTNPQGWGLPLCDFGVASPSPSHLCHPPPSRSLLPLSHFLSHSLCLILSVSSVYPVAVSVAVSRFHRACWGLHAGHAHPQVPIAHPQVPIAIAMPPPRQTCII